MSHSTNFGVASVTRKLKLMVPLCASCLASDKSKGEKAGQMIALTILTSLILASILKGATNDFKYSLVVGVIGAVIVAIVASTVGPKPLVDYDGKTIKFTNKEFNERFINLNMRGWGL